MTPEPQIDNANLAMFAATQERDIDLMLLEEFRSHPEFASWFYDQVRIGKGNSPCKMSAPACNARHSVGGSGIGAGETDLWIHLASSDPDHTHTALLLIENKITADFTRDQPMRYKQRSDTERKAAGTEFVYTVLIAPEKYLSSVHPHTFDATIAYESIRDWMDEVARSHSHHQIRARLTHRARLLSHAIEGHRRSGGRGIVYSETNTQFFERCYQLIYSEYATRLSPNSNKPRGMSSDSINCSFVGRDVLLQKCKDANCELVLSLRLSTGEVIVRFHNWPRYFSVLLEQLLPIVPCNISVRPARSGKTLDLVRDGLPVINTASGFEAQERDLRIYLDHAVLMREWIESVVPTISLCLDNFNSAHAGAT